MIYGFNSGHVNFGKDTHHVGIDTAKINLQEKCMCHVLGSVFSRITRDMLLIDDMAAEETLQVIHVMPSV